MAALRKRSAGTQMSVQEQTDAAAPMSALVAEEDAEGRKEK
jgi:hypothetical protein